MEQRARTQGVVLAAVIPRRTATSLVALLVATLPVVSGCASRATPTVVPEPGARVRVTAPDLNVRRYDGILAAMPPDTIVVDTLRLALASVTQLDRYVGKQSHPWQGAGIGFLAGWSIGFVAWHVAGAGCYEGAAQSACAAVIGGGIGALGGGMIGAAVGGFAWKTDEWQRIPVDRLQVSVVPRRGGLGIGVRVGF